MSTEHVIKVRNPKYLGLEMFTSGEAGPTTLASHEKYAFSVIFSI
jgi:hypothetical protein